MLSTNNPSVGVAGIEFFTWPDQWYHADTDTPDKGDPTEMKRVAFIGASTAWASANLTDAMVPDLLDAVSDFGYNRVAERGIPRVLDLRRRHSSLAAQSKPRQVENRTESRNEFVAF